MKYEITFKRKMHPLLGLSFFVLIHFPLSAQSNRDSLLFHKNNLTIYTSKAYYQTKELYNSQTDLQKLKQLEDTVQCPPSYTYYYNPLSLVGDYFTYEKGEYGQVACGPPGNFLAVKTINLKTFNAIQLTELFTETSVIKALKNDKWIIGRISRESFASINSIHGLLKKISENTGTVFKEDSFVVAGYNKKDQLVSIRLIASNYEGFDHYNYLQLGFWVTPKEEVKKMFTLDANFYLGRFSNGLTSKK